MSGGLKPCLHFGLECCHSCVQGTLHTFSAQERDLSRSRLRRHSRSSVEFCYAEGAARIQDSSTCLPFLLAAAALHCSVIGCRSGYSNGICLFVGLLRVMAMLMLDLFFQCRLRFCSLCQVSVVLLYFQCARCEVQVMHACHGRKCCRFFR